MFGLETETLAIYLAGLAAFLTVVAFAFAPGIIDHKKRRLAAVQAERKEIKEQLKLDRKKGPGGQVDERTLKIMRQTVERFKMEKLAENTELRLELSRAGFRGPTAPIVFLFFKIVVPMGVAAATLIYFSFLYSGDFEPTRHSIIAGMVMFGAYMLPGLYVKNLTTKRQQKMQRAFPDALDLMVICVESGMSVEKAFQKVTIEIEDQSPELAQELTILTGELSYLGDRALAYENLAKRTGMAAIKSLTGALSQAERYGTPVASALRVLSEESRGERMSMAERKAASLPAKLTVPMIVFFLPVLFVVIIGPAIIQVMQDGNPLG